MNLAQRARKSTGLDVEDFAELLGVHFRRVEELEAGSAQAEALQVALFHLITAQPQESVRVLRLVRERRAALHRRIVTAIREHGHGPKHTVTLKRLRELSALIRTRAGLEQSAAPEEVTQALLELEVERKVMLEPALEPDALGPLERSASIHDPRRGLLAYVSPGARFPRRRG